MRLFCKIRILHDVYHENLTGVPDQNGTLWLKIESELVVPIRLNYGFPTEVGMLEEWGEDGG